MITLSRPNNSNYFIYNGRSCVDSCDFEQVQEKDNNTPLLIYWITLEHKIHINNNEPVSIQLIILVVFNQRQ